MGVDFVLPKLAAKIQQKAFENGLILETCGPLDEVVKFLPALTIDNDTLLQGLSLFEKSVKEALSESDFEQKLEEEISS